MNEDMFKRLSDMLNDVKNVSESSNTSTFKDLFNSFSDYKNDKRDYNNDNKGGFNFSNIDLDTMIKLEKIMTKMRSNRSNPRSNLLMSLKPYLKSSRKDKIDQYIQLMNIATVFESLNEKTGGDK